MKEKATSQFEHEPINLREVDTFVFDYGGVVSHHYCQPWQGNLSALLGIAPEEVKKLLSESGELGRAYRLGHMTRDEFWKLVIKGAGAHAPDPAELEYNWAMSYQINTRMIDLIMRLKNENLAQVGILSNSDEYRQNHNEKMYGLSSIFDFIISSHTHKVLKPDMEAYIKVLEEAKRRETPGKVLYIDDREKNVNPGQALGIKGYVYTTFDDFVLTLQRNNIINK